MGQRYTRREVLEVADRLYSLIEDDPEKMLFVIRTAAKYLRDACKQNETKKYVRLANGKRRWIDRSEAEAVLSKPRSNRI